MCVLWFVVVVVLLSVLCCYGVLVVTVLSLYCNIVFFLCAAFLAIAGSVSSSTRIWDKFL